MTLKKAEDIALGQRIKNIRASLKMDQKSFSKRIGSTVSALSNWENGRNKPNDIMLHELSKIGNVSTYYLLTGENDTEMDLLSQITSISESIESNNKELVIIRKKIAELNTKLENPELDELTIISIENELEKRLREQSSLIAIRGLEDTDLATMKDRLKKLRDGEIFNIRDRQNPEFAANNISQRQLSENLSTLPYLLNYESTMKVAEYADLLMSKEENLYKPE